MPVRSFQRSAVSFSIDVFSAGTETGPTKTIDRHTGRVRRGGRDPVSRKFLFLLDFGYPPTADSGMTWEITSCVNTSSEYLSFAYLS